MLELEMTISVFLRKKAHLSMCLVGMQTSAFEAV